MSWLARHFIALQSQYKEHLMIVRSPYPDVEVPEISLPGFVLEHADQRGAVPAVIDAPTGRTLSYRELNSEVRCGERCARPASANAAPASAGRSTAGPA